MTTLIRVQHTNKYVRKWNPPVDLFGEEGNSHSGMLCSSPRSLHRLSHLSIAFGTSTTLANQNENSIFRICLASNNLVTSMLIILSFSESKCHVFYLIGLASGRTLSRCSMTLGDIPLVPCGDQAKTALFLVRQAANLCFNSWGRSTATRVVFSG